MIKESRCWYLTLLFLISAHTQIHSVPYYYVRSQASNSALELAGWTHEINLFNDGLCENYHTMALTFEYMQSFNPNNIARTLLGDSCLQNTSCPSFKVTGSRVANRGATDWLADYFGLPTDFESTVTLKPKIQNYVIDFNGYWGLDSIRKGLYFRVHAPVVRTQWNLNYQETVNNAGTASYIAGYFADEIVLRSQLNDDFYSYITNAQVPNLGQYQTTSKAILFTPLNRSLWAGTCQRKSKTALAEITMALGCNFWQCDNYHAGFNIRGALPTGTRPKGDYFFEPIVGNGHHWEFGVGFTGHYTFWKDCDGQKSLGLYVDANFTHLFADRQVRVFDLKNGCNSRYILTSKLGQPVNPSFTAGNPPQIPSAQFQPVTYSPVANLTQSFVNVSIGVQADITLLFNYTHCNWGLDFGYNLWTRSKENIKFDSCGPCKNPLINNKNWVLKGDAQMFGYFTNSVGQAVRLSSSQSQATIHHGTNHYAGPNTDPTSNPQAGINGVRPERNPGVDNPQLAFFGGSLISWTTTSLIPADQINTSLDPIFISPNDLDIAGAETKGASSKLFVYLGYTWENYDDCYIPYLGFGGSAEWGNRNKSCRSNNPNDIINICNNNTSNICNDNRSTIKCAVSQWALWFKGGVSFN